MGHRNANIDQSLIRTTSLNHEKFKVRKDQKEIAIRQIYSCATLFEEFLRVNFLKEEDDIFLAQEIAQKLNVFIPEILTSESKKGISVNLADENTFELRNITIDIDNLGMI